MTPRPPRSTLFPYTTLFRSKLYTIARIPRRVELRHEQADSHPSLARRIKDIRRAAGAVPAHLESAAVFTGSDGRTSVTFDQDRKSTRLNSSHGYISYAVFCLNDTPTTQIYTLSLHDALPI